MPNTRLCALLVLLAAVAPLVGGAARASAHPHVWVAVETTVLYEKGAFTGLRHRWIFDEFYTAMAIEGLDKNGDGKYDREELSELAKVNIEGLKEFGYFTFPQAAGQDLKTGEVRDYYLEHQDGILSLHFTVPFERPIKPDHKALSFTVHDPTYFIAFDFAKTAEPVKLAAGAPKGCALKVGAPQGQGSDNAKALNEAFGALGAVSVTGVKTILVECEIEIATVTPPASQQPRPERHAAATPPPATEVRPDPEQPKAAVGPGLTEPSAEARHAAAAPRPEVGRRPEEAKPAIPPPPAERRPATAVAVAAPNVGKTKDPGQQVAAVRLQKRAQVDRNGGMKRRARTVGWSRWHCMCAPRFVLVRPACR
jgi:ABC-type uncharacterized transport system substrate-binding protein